MSIIAYSYKNRFWMKLVSIALIGIFILTGPCVRTALADDLKVACIAAQSVFTPAQSIAIKHKAVLKYNLACRMMAGSIDPAATRDDVRFSADGVDLEYVFSHAAADERGKTIVLPCRYKSETYWCVLRNINDTGRNDASRYDLVFYTEEELGVSDPRELIYRSRATAREESAIERAVKSEIEHDEKIRKAIAEGRYVVIDPDNSIMSLSLVFLFLDKISPTLSGELAGLIGKGQVMVITGEDTDSALTEPHAGGRGIYLPDMERYLNPGTLVHETYAKAGFTDPECLRMENLFKRAVRVFTEHGYGPQKDFLDLITLDTEDERLLREARYASFVDLDEILDRRDYSANSGKRPSSGEDPGTGAFSRHAGDISTGVEPVGVFETDLNGMILSSNFDVHRELGLLPEDKGADLRAVIESSMEDNWDTIAGETGARKWLEIALTLPSELPGDKRSLRIYAHRMQGPETTKLVFAVFDVTGQVRLFSERGYQLNQLERVLAVASEGIAMLDERGSIISSNAGLSIMLGYEKARDIKDRDLFDFISDTSGGDKKKILDRCFSEGVVRGKEILLRTQQRDTIVARLNAVASVDDRGRRRATVALTDMTAFRRARKELESERRLLGAFVETSQNLMLETSPDRVINRISSRCLDALGYEMTDMKGKVLDDFLHPADLEKMSEDIFGMLGSRAPLAGVEYRIKKKNGSYLWAEFDADPMISDAGNVEGMVFNIRDTSGTRTYKESLESIFQNASAVTFDVDEEGVVIANAEHLIRFLGGDPRNVKGPKLAALLSTEQNLLIRDIEEVLRDRKQISRERQFRRSDGKDVDLKVHISPVATDNGETAARVIIVDISYQKKNERLFRREAHYLKIFARVNQVINRGGGLDEITDVVREGLELHSVQIGFLDEDLQVVDIEGISTLWGPIIRRLIKGLSFDLQANEKARSFFAGLDSPNEIYPEQLTEMMLAESSVTGRMIRPLAEKLFRDRLGEMLAFPILDSSGGKDKKVGVLFVAHQKNRTFEPSERALLDDLVNNISLALLKRKREEEYLRLLERLRSESERFQQMAYLLPQTIFELDAETRFTYCNRHGLEMTGYTQDEIDLGLNALDLFIPEDRPRIIENTHRIAEGAELEGHQYTMVLRDGSRKKVTIYSRPVFRNGQFAGIRGIVVDIQKAYKEKEILRVQRDINRAVNANGGIEQVLGQVLDSLLEIDGIDKGGICFFRGTSGGVVFKGDENIFSGAENAMENLFSIWAANRTKTVPKIRYASYSDLFRGKKSVPHTAAGGVKSVAILPVAVEGEAVAAILLGSSEANAIPRGVREALEVITCSASEGVERVVAQSQKRSSEAKYRELFETMNDAAAVHRLLRDEDGAIQDTVFVAVNRAFEERLDRSREQVIGRKISEVLPGVEDDEAQWLRVFDQVEKDGKPRHSEAYSEALGRWYKVSVSRYEKDHIVVLFSDITDHKEAVAELRANEQRFLEVFDRAQVGLVRFDRDGHLGDINNEAVRILGGIDPDMIKRMPAEEFCGRILGIGSISFDSGFSVSGTILIDHAELSGIGDLAVTGDKKLSVDYTITRLSLGKRMLVHLKDVTERERAEEKVREALGQLESQTLQLVQAQRFSAVGENTAALTHEINNPAANVQYLLETLLRRLRGGNIVEHDDIERDLTRASAEIDRIAEITNRFLGFASPNSAGKMPCSVEHIMRDVYEMRKGMLERRGVDVILDFDENAPMVLADSGRLKQAFLNILVNALNALDSSDKREIRFSTRSARDAGGDVVVRAAIGDTGCGIPEEDLPKIWEPFYTKRKNGIGSGIGLAMVRGVAEEHDAEINVESVPDEGTTFTFEFPAMEDRSEQLSERSDLTRVTLLRSIMHDLNNYLAAAGFIDLLRSAISGQSEIENKLHDLDRLIQPLIALAKETHGLMRGGEPGENAREVNAGLDRIASDLDMIVLSSRELQKSVSALDLGTRPVRCVSNMYKSFTQAQELMAIRDNIWSMTQGDTRGSGGNVIHRAVGDMIEICRNTKNIFGTRGIDAGVTDTSVKEGERIMVRGNAVALRQAIFHILTLGTDFNDTPVEKLENGEYKLDTKIELNRRVGEAVIVFRNRYFRFPEKMVKEETTEDGESLAGGLIWDSENITDLRVARQRAATLGGRVHIENTAEGSVVRLFLPFITEKEESSKDKKAVPAAGSQPAYLGEPERINEGGAKILVADDEPIQREMLYEVLAGQGYNVWLAADCKQAIDMVNDASRHGEPFDLAIFDVSMPPAVDEMIYDGVELTKKVRESGHAFPVFISTGHAFNDASLAGLSGEGLVAGVWQKVGGMAEKLRELENALKADMSGRSKAVDIQAGTVDRVALVYGPDLDEGRRKLCICGFKGEIRHARDAAELERHLRAGDIDIVVNTTDENLKDILSRLDAPVPVVDGMTERHELRNILLGICA